MVSQRSIRTLSILLALAGTLPVSADTTRVVSDADSDTFYVTVRQAAPVKEAAPPKAAAAMPAPVVRPETQVITAQEIATQHATNVTDALRRVNGVSINEMVPGTSAYVKLNGDDRVLVLVDGQSLANAQGSAYGRGSVDLTSLPGVGAIERIEVTRGSGSVAYGSGAVGGVINIITKKGSTTPQTTLDVNTGSWGTHGYSLSNSGQSGKTSWFVTGNIDKRSYYKFPQAYDSDESRGDYNNKSLSLRLDQKLNEANSLTLQVFHKTSDGHSSTFDKKDDRFQLLRNKVVDRLYNDYSLTWHFREDTATPGYIRYFNNYSRTWWTNHYFTRTQGLEGQNTWQIGAHRLTAGAAWTEDAGTNKEANYFDEKRHNLAGYVEDVWNIGKWTLTPGLRVDDNSTYGTHYTPRLAVDYQANDKVKVYASMARVFAPPRLNDQFYFTGSTAGNRDLEPETGYTQNLGIQYALTPKTVFDLHVFRSHLHDVIRWNRAVTPHEAENLDEEKKRGLELSLTRTINEHWRWNAGYSYTHIDVDTGDGLAFDATYNQPNGYFSSLDYTGGRWHGNVSLTAGTGRNDTYYLGSSYVVWDGTVSYELTKDCTLYVKATNFTNDAYDLYHEYPAAGRAWLVGATYTF